MIEFSSIVVLVLVFTQVLKKAFSFKSKYVPFISFLLGFGIVLSYALISKNGVMTWQAAVNTLIAIATANGIYSGANATLNK